MNVSSSAQRIQFVSNPALQLPLPQNMSVVPSLATTACKMSPAFVLPHKPTLKDRFASGFTNVKSYFNLHNHAGISVDMVTASGLTLIGAILKLFKNNYNFPWLFGVTSFLGLPLMNSLWNFSSGFINASPQDQN